MHKWWQLAFKLTIEILSYRKLRKMCCSECELLNCYVTQMVFIKLGPHKKKRMLAVLDSGSGVGWSRIYIAVTLNEKYVQQ